jgi:hypothetical protein
MFVGTPEILHLNDSFLPLTRIGDALAVQVVGDSSHEHDLIIFTAEHRESKLRIFIHSSIPNSAFSACVFVCGE